jgi:serine/threonine protein kinase
VFDFDDSEELPYLVLEFVPGGSLDDRLRRPGARLSWAAARPLLLQATDALAQAHGLGIIHRDVKPANLLIGRNGEAKLIDFGLGIPAASAGRLPETCAGSPQYMAPEQGGGSDTLDHRTDLYALGATFYHALTGRPPFSADTVGDLLAQHARAPVPPPRQFAPDLPAAAEAVLLRLLAKDPRERFASCAELREALVRLPAPPGA